jgi:dipeptidyl aminopeptidase/acylaminoacyl peptidase
MSSDGTTIPAVLRLPVTANANTKIPLIVIPHGYGETSSIRFEREADFFSAKGYAVFSPNYRSTDGFGFELRNADMGLKNDLILQDIDDGIEFLSQHHSLDMTKIHAIGYGYGGYLALLSAANYPNRYKSVAVVDPITDLADFPDHYRRVLNEIFPQLEGSDAAIQDLSPINYASQFAAHVLLISDKKSFYHSQVKNMNKRLKSESKNVRLEVFKTKHGIRDGKVREKVLEEIDDFLQM